MHEISWLSYSFKTLVFFYKFQILLTEIIQRQNYITIKLKTVYIDQAGDSTAYDENKTRNVN